MNTKRNIVFAVFAAIVLLISCDKPEPEGPDDVVITFPEVLKNFEVKPGETLSLSFTPAMDWTVSVPSDNLQWFWIADGTFKVDKLSGKPSSEAVTVKIGVSETEEFDNNRSCDVTLSIGDESKVIAQYMRPAKERSLAVYLGEGTEEISSVTVDWSAELAAFSASLRVESNCEWTLAAPEWLTVNVPENTVGVSELLLTGESLEEVSGKLQFKTGEDVIKEISVSLPSCKGIEVYSAQVDGGELVYGESGDYLWTETAVENVSLAWLGTDFRMPVRISSKCQWTVELPEWLTAELPENTAGDVSFTLMGVSSKYPLEETTDKVVFKSGDTVIGQIQVTVPGCKDIFSYSLGMALTELEFNADGHVKTSTGYEDVDVTASLFGTSKVDVVAVEFVDGKYAPDQTPEWMNIAVSSFNTASDAPVLQEREVRISVTQNNSGDRKAVLLFVPHSLAGNIKAAFADDLTAVREEYAAYAVSVFQHSNQFVITMNSSQEAMAEVGATFEDASAEKKAELTAAFGDTDQVYVLTYEDIYSLDEARMSMSRTFGSFKVFDSNKTDQSAVEDFWLAFNSDESASAGVVEMYFNSDPELLPELPSSASTGYVVFYDTDGTVLAIIECVSPYKEESENPGGGSDDSYITDDLGNVYFENTSYFADPEAAAAAGAKVYELVSGTYYDQYEENGCPVILLEYDSLDTEVEIVLPSSISFWYVMPYMYNSYVMLNDKTIANTSGILGKSVDKVSIKMMEEVYTNRDEIETSSKDKPAGLKVTLHKNMSAQDPTLVIFCRLNLSE